MTFGEKLKQLRDAASISERELAERSGVPFGTLHNYGVGIRKPTFAAAVKLAAALGVSCEVFAKCDDMATEPAAKKSARAKK
jgi:transcriptional regulator with XRE-family HTH domain